MLSRLPAKARRGVGIRTFTDIFCLPAPSSCASDFSSHPHDLNLLLRESRSILRKLPGAHFLRSAFFHAHDNIAVPRPGVLAIILAGPRWMVGVRMIPADHFQPVHLCPSFFCLAHIICGYRKTVARRILAPIDERQ